MSKENVIVEQSEGALVFWELITVFGSAAVLLPVWAMAAIGLGVNRQWVALRCWGQTLAAACLLCLATKIAYLGWGWGVRALDFTGVSGHALLAAAILPVVIGCVAPSERLRPWAVIVGVGVSAVIAWSRAVIGAHSLSEVVLGWGLGTAVALATVRSLPTILPARQYFLLALCGLGLALHPTATRYLPSHALEVKLALWLSGHATPYVRGG